MSDPKSPKFRAFVPFDNDTLAALDAAHGDIRVVRGETPPAKKWKPDELPEPPWEVVYRKPTQGEADAFEGSVHNERAKSAGLRNLAKATIVGVSVGGIVTTCADRSDAAAVRKVRDAWDALREAHPSVHVASAGDLMSLAGMSAEEEGKG